MVRIEKRDGIFIVYIPPISNLRSSEDLIKTFKSLESAEGLSAVILASDHPKFWNAGNDFKEMMKLGPSHMVALVEAKMRVLHAILTVNVPTIACVTGHAQAGGCLMAMACDYRVMSKEKAFLQMGELYAKVVTPTRGSKLLMAKVHPNVYKDMLLRAKRFLPEDCLKHQLVEFLSEAPLEKAIELAKEVSMFGENNELYGATRLSVYGDVIKTLEEPKMTELETRINRKAFGPKL